MINNLEAEKNYLKEFPKRTSEELKYEIGKIAELLVENKESNRYTEILRRKASKDKKIQDMKQIESVDIIKFENGKMKAGILYRNLDYKLVLDMETVSRGRLFLNGYNTVKK